MWDGSFEHPKHMFKLMDKKIIAILPSKILLIWPYVNCDIFTFISMIWEFESKKSLYFSAFWFLWAIEISCSVELSIIKVW